jgi:predicted  nucleic acid-binding Zn-ribbon protein
MFRFDGEWKERKGTREVEGEIDKFAVLEEKITQFVEAYASLSAEKTALGKKLAQKEMEVQGLMEKVARLSQEREAARERVEGLLNRLDRVISFKDMVHKG